MGPDFGGQVCDVDVNGFSALFVGRGDGTAVPALLKQVT